MILGCLDLRGSGPRIVLDDGRTLAVEYEVLDPVGLSHGDRVRAEVRGSDVRSLVPARTIAEAIALLAGAGVLPPGTAAPVDEHGASWPRTLLEVVHDNDTTDALFSHDHHYLDASQLGRWAARSGLPSSSLADPSDDVEGRQLCAAINRALAGSDSPYRWYSLASDDARSAYVRLDRALATALGVGIFES